MPSSPLSVIVQQLRAAAGRDGAGRTDAELLTLFLNRRDEDALAALVERHAPMVWGVCCRVLRNPHDAEDAFQATFLVLVQKAGTVVPRDMVANWLHGVARQTAVRLRATVAKRGWREVQMNEMPEPAVVKARDEELLSRLDEELSRLPERFRALIVLCDLEGHTRKEVARQLGCPEGTVASGLVRARKLLAKRLPRQGLAVSGGSLAATLSHSVASADVPASVVTSAINVATLLAAGKAAGMISGPVATLTQGVLKTMFLKKIMTTAVAVLALGVAVVTGGSLVMGQTEQPSKLKVVQDVKPPVEKLVELAAKQPKQKKEEEAFTAWGEEQPGGVRIGLGYLPGEKRVYSTGESVTLVVRAKNVGKEEVNLEYVRDLWSNYPPAITDGDGKKYPIPKVMTDLIMIPVEATLKAGKETELYQMKLELRPAGEADDKQVMKVFGTGKFQIWEENGLMGKTWAGDNRAAATDRALPSGKLELEVTDKPPVAEKQVEEELTAWGKEVGGLQAGLSVRPGDKKVYRHGETVTLVVRVRNVGKEAASLQCSNTFPLEKPPVVTDGTGKLIPIMAAASFTSRTVKKADLAPGQEIEVYEWHLELRPSEESAANKHSTLCAAGKVQIHFSTLAEASTDQALSKLATGKLDLVINAAPAGKQKVLTPEEAVRAAYDPRRAKEFNDTKPAVEFKVEDVTRATGAKVIEVPKDAVWEKGRGPEDVGLRSRTPLDGVQVRFGAVLTADVIRRLNRAGVTDIEKHFRGKTVRVTGTISKHDHNIYGRTVEVEIVVDDLDQLEVVK